MKDRTPSGMGQLSGPSAIGPMPAIRLGDRLTYNDGRIDHTEAMATVIAMGPNGIVVQFDDRADSTFIRLGDRAWWDHLSPAHK